jgi:hypothetical protein
MSGPTLAPEELRLFARSENPACIYADFVEAAQNEYMFSRAYASVPPSLIARVLQILEADWQQSLRGRSPGRLQRH